MQERTKLTSKANKSIKKILLPIIVVATVYVVVRIILPHFWHSPPYHNRTISRQEIVARNRVYGLLVSGEEAWKEGHLKVAENKFKACLNDKANFDNKADYDRKARANLAKLLKQQGRAAEEKALLAPN